MNWPMRFGVFLAPFNPVGQNPTVALEKDLELIDATTTANRKAIDEYRGERRALR